MSNTDYPPVLQKVQRNGQSVSIYLPQKVIDRCPLKPGDIVGIRVVDGCIVAQKIDLSQLAKLRAQRY